MNMSVAGACPLGEGGRGSGSGGMHAYPEQDKYNQLLMGWGCNPYNPPPTSPLDIFVQRMHDDRQ